MRRSGQGNYPRDRPVVASNHDLRFGAGFDILHQSRQVGLGLEHVDGRDCDLEREVTSALETHTDQPHLGSFGLPGDAVRPGNKP